MPKYEIRIVFQCIMGHNNIQFSVNNIVVKG
ncbi:MAG: hypothetical protein RL732_1583 [Bacteroidota bacterium]|jgi:hypothetical protein